MSADVPGIQRDLRAAKIGGWLFYDFRGRDPIAQNILGLPEGMRTRRWFYFVPAKGTPKKLVHKIETQSLATLPGDTLYYAAQDELRSNLKKMFGRAKSVAMQYSPKNAIPYVAMVDAGTIELVRSSGPKVVSSGDLLLMDVWGKKKASRSVYYDVTWMGYLGARVPEKFAKVFSVVREARDTATDLIRKYVAAGKPLQGWQVDKAARRVIEKAGYGKYFFHRTGHSIGERVHGNGVNMDGLETHDVRHLIPHTCNSIEPGIYLPEFGVRSEVNVYIGDGEARVTGGIQNEILTLLA